MFKHWNFESPGLQNFFKLLYCMLYTVCSCTLCALINKCLYLCIRLLLQQERLRSLSPGHQMIPRQQKSLKQVFQQVNKTLALTSWLLPIRKALFVLIHFCFFIFLTLAPPPPPKMLSLLFYILIFFLFHPPFLFLFHHKNCPLTLISFMLVSLRLASFYTVASEECGHRRWER